MTTATPIRHPLPVLKGAAFAERLAGLGRRPAPVQPLPGLRHRNILVPGLVGGEVQFALVGLLAEALRQRGAAVTALLCDSFLPVCALQKVDHEERACDRWCHVNGRAFIEALGLSHRWYGEFVTEAERRECADRARRITPEQLPELEWRNVPLGEHVMHSIEGFFKVGRYDPADPRMRERAADFAAAAMLMVAVSERALDQLDVHKVVMNDGQKIKWGILRDVARRRGVPVEVVRAGARASTVWFERDGSTRAHPGEDGWDHWKDVPLEPDQQRDLARYMDRRALRPYEGNALCSWTRPFDDGELRRRLGLEASTARRGRVFGMFPNLSYDAGKTASRPAFPTAAKWVIETVRFFAERPQHRLIVKTNPTEQIRRALDPLEPAVRAHFDPLPPHITILPPDTPIPAQALLRHLDAALVYTSTVAIEAAYRGLPVLFVGGGRHGRRGFTIDVSGPEAYFGKLRELCEHRPVTRSARQLAERYAYMVFFRHLLPLGYVEHRDRNVTGLHLCELADLGPGRDPVVDHICRGILLDEPIGLDRWPGT